MTPPPSFDPRSLSEHNRFVGALAAHLVADAHLAEDLGQDAWLAALERGPVEPDRLRRWLSGVVRRRALHVSRSEAHRRDRESTSARIEPAPSSLELLEKLSEQRRVVDAVVSLAEPYRETILLRYFEDLGPEEIARRTGTPLATVKTRLQRALAQLRELLDREHGGDGRTWLAVIVPLVTKSGPLAGGALLVGTKTTWIAAAAALVIAAAGALWYSSAPAAPTVRAVAGAGEATVGFPEQPPVVHEAQREQRETVAVAEPAPVVAPAPANDELFFARVLTCDARPVSGVKLAFTGRGGERKELDLTHSDARGELHTLHPGAPGRLRTEDPRWATVMEGVVGAPRAALPFDVPPTVVIAPSASIAGVVVDEEGRGVANASVGVYLLGQPRRIFDFALDASEELRLEGRADGAGAFHLEGVPAIRKLGAWASGDGYRPAYEAMQEGPREDLRIVLRRLDQAQDLLIGEVVDEDDHPIEGARVALGGACATTRANGHFDLTLPRNQDVQELAVIAKGHLPVRIAASPGAKELRDRWPRFVRVVLSERPLSIAGRVLEEDGRPAAGVKVTLVDTTEFGTIEADLGGASIHYRASVESLATGGDGVDPSAKTAADGAFRIEGLLDRPYELEATDEATLRTVRTAAIAAGSKSIEIRLPPRGELTRVAGRVVFGDRTPAAGVDVTPLLDPSAGAAPGDAVTGGSVQTDAQGAFVFEALPLASLALRVTGKSIGWRTFPVQGDPASIELVVPRPCHFRVDLGARPDRADGFRVLDGADRELSMSMTFGQTILSHVGGTFAGGRSDVMTVDETARTLVVYLGMVEVERVPIAFAPGDLNKLDL